MPSDVDPRNRWKAVALCLSLSALSWAAPALAGEGRFIHNQTLYAIENLGTDQGGIVARLTFDVSMQAAIQVDDDWLGLGRLPGETEESLLRLDGDTGALLESMPVTAPDGVDFFISLERDLTGDLVVFGDAPSGGLATFVGTLDPSTGVVTERFVVDERIGGLTIEGGETYTLIGDFDSEDPEMFLARIDLETGSLEPLASLPSTWCSAAGDLAFDRGGVLHVTTATHKCGIIHPSLAMSIASFAPFDLDAPPAALELVAFQPSGLFGNAAALEVSGSVSPIDVPLGLPTTLGLLLGLMAAGWLILRARPA